MSTASVQALPALDVPLCVDLDGTLIRSDTLLVSALALIRARPLLLALFPFWLLLGRARFKREVASRAAIDPARLPYNDKLLERLRRERNAGRRIWLVTAADRGIAHAVADHLGIFSEVLSSDGARNLKGVEKLRALQARFPAGFDYAGNSAADLPIWRHARCSIVVNASPRVARAAIAQARVVTVIP